MTGHSFAGVEVRRYRAWDPDETLQWRAPCLDRDLDLRGISLRWPEVALLPAIYLASHRPGGYRDCRAINDGRGSRNE